MLLGKRNGLDPMTSKEGSRDYCIEVKKVSEEIKEKRGMNILGR